MLVVADLTNETQNDQNNHHENDYKYHCQPLVAVVWSRAWSRSRCRWRGCWSWSVVVERILTLFKHNLWSGEISVVGCALSYEKLGCLSAWSAVLNKVSEVVGEEGRSEDFETCRKNVEGASSLTVSSSESWKRHSEIVASVRWPLNLEAKLLKDCGVVWTWGIIDRWESCQRRVAPSSSIVTS